MHDTIPRVRISRSVTIERPSDDVYAFVDARNDPRWRHEVRSVEQVEGDAPGAGARYRVVHRPMLAELRALKRLVERGG